ncbi:hypothetical protein [Lutibacter sp.]|uniref:hypothetical protein n=1 Tax=Lutibacter sp. TaxID=1925666 RepID=UPI0025C26B1E|nr:hypothetical protein [Lutibacter sp.]MCF6182761.1 hypothetical protein [Lutibacter sp.]
MNKILKMDKMIINSEECRNIIGFERYHVSESGRVYRTEIGKKRSWRTKGRICINENKVHFRVQNGKLRQGQVSLTDTNGKLHNVGVATLVARVFGVIDKKMISNRQKISYKDYNKKNLHYTNLFITEKVYSNSKLNKKDIKHIKKYIKQGVSLRYISRIFCVSEMQINRIKTGENWGNGKRKIKAPKAPFEIKEVRMKKYIATFDRKKTVNGIRKRFTVKRNPKSPTDNLIIGIINGYKLSLKHTNITRAKKSVKTLNEYFFESKIKKEKNTLFNKKLS